MPVIVYIHGGGFVSGSAHPNSVGPEYFMDGEDVIFIAINYRLGVLGVFTKHLFPFYLYIKFYKFQKGFMSTGTIHCPGNFGLKDQKRALRWIQRHIEFFGGNKRSVTLMGVEAGAASAHIHMMSNSTSGNIRLYTYKRSF